MGMLGSAFGRAAAGFGSAVASISNKYIDEELQANRAKMMAELQHANMVRADQYQNDPTRRGMLREQAGLDATAAASAAAAGQRAAAVAGQGDAAYQSALDQQAAADAERKARGEVAGGMIADPYRRQKAAEDAKATAATNRDIAKDTAADPDFLKAQTKIKLADPEVAARIKASAASAAASYASAANSSAHAEQAREQTKGLAMVNKLKAEADVILNDDKIDDKTRKEKLAVIDERLIAMGGKQRAGRDPELDTVTTERVTDDGKGGTVKTIEKSVRRPGQKAEEADPIKAAMDAAREAKAKAEAANKPAAGGGMINVPTQAQPPALGAIDQGIYADLQPLKDQYEQAKAQLQAAAKSGDQQSIARYSQAVNAAAAALRREAQGRLGNGAPRFLAGVL
jgi:hypothetical protein